MRRLGQLLISARSVLAALALAGLIASAWALPQLRIDLSIVPLLRSSAEAEAELEAFREKVPRLPFVLALILEWPEPFGADEMPALRAAHQAVKALPHAGRVHSLATVKLLPRGAALPVPVPFQTLCAERRALDVALEHPLLHGKLMSEDGRSAAIFMGSRGSREALLEELEALAAELEADGLKVRVVGAQVIERTMNRLLIRDMARSLLLETLGFIILLPLLFRSVRGLVLPVLVVNAALLLNFGVMVALGRALTIIGVAIPGLIAVIALCDAIHMLHSFEDAFAETGDRRAAILAMMERTGLACFFTSVTTGIGFLSLLLAPHAAVRDFALSASLAVMVAFVVVVALLPVALAFWPLGAAVRRPPRRWTLGYGRPKLTWLAFLALAGLSLWQALGISVDSRWLEELPADAPEVRDYQWFEDHYHGIVTLEVRLEGPLLDPAVAREVDRIARALKGTEGVRGVESYVDWMREVLGAEGELDAEQLRAGLARLELLGKGFPKHMLSQDASQGILLLRIRELGTRHFLALVGEVEAAAQGGPEALEVQVGAATRLAHESSRLVVDAMVRSLAMSLVSIALLSVLLLRSLRLGLLAMIPNALPILVALGINGALGIELRIGIIMIYSLGIGLAVDDTIHVLARVLFERRRDPGATTRQLLDRALASSGSALIMTSSLLVLAALCFLPSSFKTLRDVGLLLTPIVISAALGDLFWLPHLITLAWGERPPPR